MKKPLLSRFSEQYLTALRNHFDQGPEAGLQTANALGRKAVAQGLETLELARIHEHAMAALMAPEDSAATRTDLTRRCEVFFTEAIVPIEETHATAIEAGMDMDRLNATLDQRTRDVADSICELQNQITRRQTMEASLRNGKQASNQLLEESLALENHLQEMAGKIVSATEEERKKMSLLLNDEIAQTLLGINIRMLALNKQIATSHTSLTTEITTIQRLIEDSAAILNRIAHEFTSEHAR